MSRLFNIRNHFSAHITAFLLLAFQADMGTAQTAHAQPTVNLGVSWSFLHVDDIEFAAVTDFFVTEVTSHQSNHDGEMNNYKLHGGLTGLLPHRRGDWLLSLAANGFYARYEDNQRTRCVFTTSSDCVFFPLTDPDPSGIFDALDRQDKNTNGTISGGGADASGGFFSDWLTDVNRSVVHWGASLEINFSRPSVTIPSGSLKDAPVPVITPAPFQWRAGLAYRQFNQTTALFSEDRGPTLDPVTLNDDLDANYYGGFIGINTLKPITDTVRLRLSGETGLYYVETDYSGAYTATASLGDDRPVASSITLSDKAPAIIGALNLSVEREVGTAMLALFGEAEWISYVPKVLYNDTDLNGGVPFDIVGAQNGTSLGKAAAISYTVGARVSVPLH